MSFSKFSVLAVFLMMVMSVFVAIPTYNVGADEPGCMNYEDTNGNGLYDADEPCHDDDDFDAEFQSVLIEMISLSQWDVSIEGEF